MYAGSPYGKSRVEEEEEEEEKEEEEEEEEEQGGGERMKVRGDMLWDEGSEGSAEWK